MEMKLCDLLFQHPSPSGFQLLASMTSFAGGQESARAAGEERGTLERG